MDFIVEELREGDAVKNDLGEDVHFVAMRDDILIEANVLVIAIYIRTLVFVQVI